MGEGGKERWINLEVQNCPEHFSNSENTQISWDGGFGGHSGKEEGAQTALIPELSRQPAGPQLISKTRKTSKREILLMRKA